MCSTKGGGALWYLPRIEDREVCMVFLNAHLLIKKPIKQGRHMYNSTLHTQHHRYTRRGALLCRTYDTHTLPTHSCLECIRSSSGEREIPSFFGSYPMQFIVSHRTMSRLQSSLSWEWEPYTWYALTFCLLYPLSLSLSLRVNPGLCFQWIKIYGMAWFFCFVCPPLNNQRSQTEVMSTWSWG